MRDTMDRSAKDDKTSSAASRILQGQDQVVRH